MRLVLQGSVPSKKNRRHVCRRGGVYYDEPGTQSEMDFLVFQARRQWQGHPIKHHASVRAIFHVTNRRGDLDNKLGTLLDCLVTSGVLHDDNIMHLVEISASVLWDGSDYTVVEVGP